MTTSDWWNLATVLLVFFWTMFWYFQVMTRMNHLESKVARYEQVRERLYASLADPEKIEADFEKSARAREMRDANRTTLPREGAGPPAKVHRPKMRGKKPGNWRVQRP
jgi:hypothetical protein